MKRKFSLFVAAACLFSSLSFGSLAHAATAFTDVTNTTPNSEAILTLTKLGVINGYANDDNTTYSFKPNGDITRGEFAKIITVALGAENEIATSSIQFNDIDGHWAKPYVLVAASRGIVNGFEDGTFKPDENVTYEQAVKMIVCAAGYESIAQSLGGWPNGYMMQAMNLKLTDDAVTADQTGKASRGIVAQLMYNVLDVDIPVYNSVTGRVEDNLKTFMETYLGIVMVDAQLVGVEEKTVANYVGPTLYVGEMGIKLKNGSVMVLDYSGYTQDKASLEAYVGQDAVVYYKEGKSGNMASLYEIDFAVAKNTVTTIISNDIESFSGNTLKYYTSGTKTKTLKLATSDVSVYYNGKLANDATDVSDWLDPADTENFIYGEVKLTDRGSDGEFDTVEIMDYKIIVATRTPSTEDYKVINKVKFTVGQEPTMHLDNVYLNPEDLGYTVNVIDENGNKVAPTTIVANDVLLVAQSEDETIRTVVICPAPVTGKITASSASEGLITINNKQYKISDYASEYFEDKISTETGDRGTFYADKYNTIHYATQSTANDSSSPYAYIIKVTYDEDEETGKLTAYVPSQSSVKTYTLSGKIKYNGETMSVQEVNTKLRANALTNVANPDMPTDTLQVYGTREETDENGDPVDVAIEPTLTNACQVARLVLDETQVKEIEVADPADYPANYGAAEDTSKIKPFLELQEVEYSGAGNFSGKFNASDSATTIIYIPQNRSEESSYVKKKMSSFTAYEEYYVQAYNVNESKTAALVLVYGSSASTIYAKTNTEVYLMAKNPQEAAGDDGNIYNIEYYKKETSTVSKATASKEENQKSASQATYDVEDIGNIEVGDFFRTGTDASGLVNAELIIKYSDVMAEIDDDCDFTGAGFRKDAGYVEIYVANVVDVLDDNKIVLSRDGFDEEGVHQISDEEHISIDSKTVVYKMSSDGQSVVPCTDWVPSDLIGSKYNGKDSNKVCVYSYGGSTVKPVKMILIYK